MATLRLSQVVPWACFAIALQGTSVGGVANWFSATSTSFVRSQTPTKFVYEARLKTLPRRANASTQRVHWVFTTDCSAYQYNQGNLLLASAYHVGQPGEFTWITNGCSREEQRAAFEKLAHPHAKVWHAPEASLLEPTTGKDYAPFQASNRPVSIAAWLRATRPQEDAIGIVDPDMIWLRQVSLVSTPEKGAEAQRGPWKTMAAKPKMGTGALYGQGCVPNRWDDQTMLKICGGRSNCVHVKKDFPSCARLYASGPPWIIHKSDAEDVFGAWTETAVKVHEAFPDMLAEQVSYGVTQMRFNVENKLDPFWFLSNTDDSSQPWKAVSLLEYDPCQARSPPSSLLSLPPLWHSCSTYEIPHMLGQGFRLHKDHIHKDILDCDSPLLHYPPQDALENHYKGDSHSFRETWSVCTYTNLVNFYAAQWKKRFCEKPNLEASFKYPPHAQSFLNKSSWLKRVFRQGGWDDVDYKVSS